MAGRVVRVATRVGDDLLSRPPPSVGRWRAPHRWVEPATRHRQGDARRARAATRRPRRGCSARSAAGRRGRALGHRPPGVPGGSGRVGSARGARRRRSCARCRAAGVVLLACDLPAVEAPLVELLARWPGRRRSSPWPKADCSSSARATGRTRSGRPRSLAAGERSLRHLLGRVDHDLIEPSTWGGVAPPSLRRRRHPGRPGPLPGAPRGSTLRTAGRVE